MMVFKQCMANINKNGQCQIKVLGKVADIVLLHNYFATLYKPEQQLNILDLLGKKHNNGFFKDYTFRQYIVRMVSHRLFQFSIKYQNNQDSYKGTCGGQIC